MLQRIPNNSLFIGTFHTFCADVLYKKNVIPKQSNMLADDDSKSLMEEAIQFVLTNEHISSTKKLRPSQLLNYNAIINQKKYEFSKYLRAEVSKDFDLLEEGFLHLICEKYESLKHDSISIDFDDIIILTIHYLLNNKSELNYRWIQIDEVQDLNVFQWEIIELLK